MLKHDDMRFCFCGTMNGNHLLNVRLQKISYTTYMNHRKHRGNEIRRLKVKTLKVVSRIAYLSVPVNKNKSKN